MELGKGLLVWLFVALFGLVPVGEANAIPYVDVNITSIQVDLGSANPVLCYYIEKIGTPAYYGQDVYDNPGNSQAWEGFFGGSTDGGDLFAQDNSFTDEGWRFTSSRLYLFTEPATVTVSFDWSIAYSGSDGLGVVDVLTEDGTRSWMSVSSGSGNFSGIVEVTPTVHGNLLYIRAWVQRSEHPVPEPATMLLLGSGLVGIAACMRKFKK